MLNRVRFPFKSRQKFSGNFRNSEPWNDFQKADYWKMKFKSTSLISFLSWSNTFDENVWSFLLFKWRESEFSWKFQLEAISWNSNNLQPTRLVQSAFDKRRMNCNGNAQKVPTIQLNRSPASYIAHERLKIVSNNMSPTETVTNIRHQHRYRLTSYQN